MNPQEKLELLDILFEDRKCFNCNHAYNCTGYGNPCDNWIRITKAGITMRDCDHGLLDMNTEFELISLSQIELEERRKRGID